MELNLFDRFILTIYSLALIVISIAALGILLNYIPLAVVQDTVADIYGSTAVHIPYVIVVVIFFLISLRFFFGSFIPQKSRQEKAIRQRGEYGEVHITLNTIQSIAERVARKVKGVRELRTTVKALESGNIISLRVTVDGETSIPEMTQALQYEVKTNVETIAGVDITEVKVIVAEVVTQDTPPVRTRRVE